MLVEAALLLVLIYLTVKDVKTTDIPSEVPALVIALALFASLSISLTRGNLSTLASSISVGLAFSLIGFALYVFGQWGDGDAAILAMLGFCSPFLGKLFPFLFFPLLFICGAFYAIGEAIRIGLRSKVARKKLRHELKGITSRSVLAAIAAFSICLLFCFLSRLAYFPLDFTLLIPCLAFLLNFTYEYAKLVERTCLIKQVSVNELREGDVLLSAKTWKGLTKKEIERLKRSGIKYVRIKTGIPFAPAFLLAFCLAVFLRAKALALLPVLRFIA